MIDLSVWVEFLAVFQDYFPFRAFVWREAGGPSGNRPGRNMDHSAWNCGVAETRRQALATTIERYHLMPSASVFCGARHFTGIAVSNLGKLVRVSV